MRDQAHAVESGARGAMENGVDARAKLFLHEKLEEGYLDSMRLSIA